MNRANQSRSLNSKKKILLCLGGIPKSIFKKPTILNTTLDVLGDFL
jgi:hypothetical protein